MIGLGRWRKRVSKLKTDTYALYLASRDPRVPWYAKAVAGLTVAYAVSPIDLIPDFIPVIGHLDDLVLIPLGLALAARMIPPAILAEHRAEAARRFERRPRSRVVPIIIIVVLIWLLVVIWLVHLFWKTVAR